MNKWQKKGLLKLGDTYCPGSADFPKFSNTSALERTDEMFPYLPKQDAKDLMMLLSVLAFVPRFVILGIILLLEKLAAFPGGVGSFARKTRIGLKGLIYGLYYSDPNVHKVIGYDVSVKPLGEN